MKETKEKFATGAKNENLCAATGLILVQPRLPYKSWT